MKVSLYKSYVKTLKMTLNDQSPCLTLYIDGDEGKDGKGGLVSLYEKLQKTINALPEDKKKHVSVMIDDISLMEVAANGASDYVLDFLHYCHALTSEYVRSTAACQCSLWFC